jgi:hypothetical protein
MSIDKKLVAKAVLGALEPLFELYDFKIVESRRRWRCHVDSVQVVSLEFFSKRHTAQWGIPASSFALSTGVFLLPVPSIYAPTIATRDGVLLPEPAQCHIRFEPARRIRQRDVPSNVWAVGDSEADLQLAVDDAAGAMREHGFPWLEQVKDLDYVLKLLRESEEEDNAHGRLLGFGRLGSPVRNVIRGFMELHAGNYASACDHLEAALRKGDLAALSGRNSIVKEIDDALKRAMRARDA